MKILGINFFRKKEIPKCKGSSHVSKTAYMVNGNCWCGALSFKYGKKGSVSIINNNIKPDISISLYI